MRKFSILSRKEYVVLYLLGALWITAMVVFGPHDKNFGTWGGVITSPNQTKQNILLELNADGSEKIDVVTKQGSLIATGSYEFSGISLTQSIVSIRQQGTFNGPSKTTITGTFRCKIAGDTLELDKEALPLDKTADLPSSDKVILSRLSENNVKGNHG